MTFDWHAFFSRADSYTLTATDASAAHSAIDTAFSRSLKVQEYHRKSAEHRDKMAEHAAATAPIPPAWISGIEASLPMGDVL